MSTTITTKKDGKETEHLLLDKSKDVCPICETPLEHTMGTWNIFHGEVSAQCCGAPYQTKDYYVDPEKSEGYDKFFEQLNKPGIWSLSIPQEWVKPYNLALKEMHTHELSKAVNERAEQIHDELEAKNGVTT